VDSGLPNARKAIDLIWGEGEGASRNPFFNGSFPTFMHSRKSFMELRTNSIQLQRLSIGQGFRPYGSDHDGPWRGYQAIRSEFDSLLLARARSWGVNILQPHRAIRVLRNGDRISGAETTAGNVIRRVYDRRLRNLCMAWSTVIVDLSPSLTKAHRALWVCSGRVHRPRRGPIFYLSAGRLGMDCPYPAQPLSLDSPLYEFNAASRG
jgi:hypothetical protein